MIETEGHEEFFGGRGRAVMDNLVIVELPKTKLNIVLDGSIKKKLI